MKGYGLVIIASLIQFLLSTTPGKITEFRKKHNIKNKFNRIPFELELRSSLNSDFDPWGGKKRIFNLKRTVYEEKTDFNLWKKNNNVVSQNKFEERYLKVESDPKNRILSNEVGGSLDCQADINCLSRIGHKPRRNSFNKEEKKSWSRKIFKQIYFQKKPSLSMLKSKHEGQTKIRNEFLTVNMSHNSTGNLLRLDELMFVKYDPIEHYSSLDYVRGGGLNTDSIFTDSQESLNSIKEHPDHSRTIRSVKNDTHTPNTYRNLRNFEPWAGKRNEAKQVEIIKRNISQFNCSENIGAWSCKRNYSPWGGKKNYNPWGGKRNYNPWGGKRNYNPWGGKRNYNPWGGKRNYNPWGRKKYYNPWGGKRNYNTWKGEKNYNIWSDKRNYYQWISKRNRNPWDTKRNYSSCGVKRNPYKGNTDNYQKSDNPEMNIPNFNFKVIVSSVL